MMGRGSDQTPVASETPVAPRRPHLAAQYLRRALRPAVLAWAGLIFSVIHLFRQLGSADPGALEAWLSSDTLWQANVFTDVFRDHYSLSGWVFSIAPCWFPDLFATGIFWLLTRNVILAALCAGFIQIGLLIGALHLCRKALSIGAPDLQDTLLLAMGVAVALYVSTDPSRLYPGLYQFFLPQTHVGSLIVVVCALGLSLLLIAAKRASGRPQGSLWIAYAGVCLLGGMSNLLFFVHLLLPLSMALFFAWFFGMLAGRELRLPLAIGWTAAACGAVLNRILFHVSDVSTQSGISVNLMLQSLDVFLRGAMGKILAHDVLHLLAITWAVVCVAYILLTLRRMILRPREQLGLRRTLAWIFFSTCLLASLCGTAAIIVGGSNGLADLKNYVWTMHYLHPAFLLPVFGLVMVLSWAIALRFSPRVCRSVAILAAAFAVLSPLYAIAAGGSPRRELSSYRPPLVHFMDELARQEGLRYGYASYWQARVITLLSNRGLRVYAVDGVLNPLLWVNNREWYVHAVEDRTRRPPVDFVILDDPYWTITRENAVRMLGEPTREVRFGITRVLIYSKSNRMLKKPI